MKIVIKYRKSLM